MWHNYQHILDWRSGIISYLVLYTSVQNIEMVYLVFDLLYQRVLEWYHCLLSYLVFDVIFIESYYHFLVLDMGRNTIYSRNDRHHCNFFIQGQKKTWKIEVIASDECNGHSFHCCDNPTSPYSVPTRCFAENHRISYISLFINDILTSGFQVFIDHLPYHWDSSVVSTLNSEIKNWAMQRTYINLLIHKFTRSWSIAVLVSQCNTKQFA